MSSPLSAAERPLHIEVVTDTYAPDINGVAMSLERLCRGLRGRGHRVDVIRSGKMGGEGEIPVPWWPLPGYWEIRVGAPWPGQLLRRWRRERPDVVYVAIETPLGFSALRAARRLGIPVVGGFHTHFRQYLQRYGARRIGEFVWAYQKWFHRRVALTVVPSPEARDGLAAEGFPRVEVVGRGVDTTLFDPGRRDPALRREWGVANPGSPVALIVGRISAEKNFGLALEALEPLRRRDPDLVAVVVGDGPARSGLEKAHPGVSFTGYRTGEALAACYASADLLLFPSETETFGNVLLEAMASGLAVLAYDYAAAAWHGRHEHNCLKVAKGDSAAFIAAAARLTDPALRTRLATAARQTAETLDWSSAVADFDRHLRAAIRG